MLRSLSARLGVAACTPCGRLRFAPRSLRSASAVVRLRAAAAPASFVSGRAVQSCFAGRLVARAPPSGLLSAALRLPFGRCAAAFGARSSSSFVVLLVSPPTASPARSTRNGPPPRPPLPPDDAGGSLLYCHFLVNELIILNLILIVIALDCNAATFDAIALTSY